MNVHYATRWKTGLYRLKWVFSTSQRRNDKVKRFRHRWKFNRGKILLLVLNANFKIQNLKNKILNPKINIQNAKIKILDPKAKIKNPKIKILNPRTKIWNLTLKKLKNLKIQNVQFKIQIAKLSRTQVRTIFEFRFVISDVFPQFFVLSAYTRNDKVQC